MSGRKSPDSEGVEFKIALGRNIYKARRVRKLTGTQLALEVNRTKQTISGWETGDVAPDLWLVPRIAEALHVSTDFLFEGTLRMPSRGSLEWVRSKLLDRLGMDRMRALLVIRPELIDEFLAQHLPPGDRRSRSK